MGINVNLGSEFLSMTRPIDKSWLRNIYFGPTDRTGVHGHISTSGSIMASTWYARNLDNEVLIKNGSEFISNAHQLLLRCIPETLRVFQSPEQPLLWNIGSLDSFFLSQKFSHSPKNHNP